MNQMQLLIAMIAWWGNNIIHLWSFYDKYVCNKLIPFWQSDYWSTCYEIISDCLQKIIRDKE